MVNEAAHRASIAGPLQAMGRDSDMLRYDVLHGGIVPEGAAIGAYHRSLETATGQRIALTDVRRVTDASELRTLLLHWPPFLANLSPHQLSDVVRRVHLLAGKLEVVQDARDHDDLPLRE